MAGLKSVSDAVKKILGRLSGGSAPEAAKEPAKNWAAKRLEKQEDLAKLGITPPPQDAGVLAKMRYESNFDASERSSFSNRFRKIAGTAVVAGVGYGVFTGVTSPWKSVDEDPGSLGDGYTLNSHLLSDKVEGVLTGLGNALPGKDSKNSPTSLVTNLRMSSCINKFGKDGCYTHLRESRALHPAMAEEFRIAKDIDAAKKVADEKEAQATSIAKAEAAASAAKAGADESAATTDRIMREQQQRATSGVADMLKEYKQQFQTPRTP